MSETLIFCGSYPQIKNTLYLIENTPSDQRISIVIPDHEDLYRFFTEVNKGVFSGSLDIIFIRRYSGKRAAVGNFLRYLFVIPDIIREKRYLSRLFRKHFARLSGCDVWYSSHSYSPYTYYFLKKLTAHNKIHYIPDPSGDDRVLVKPSLFIPSELVTLVIGKLIFGTGLTRMQMASSIFFTMSATAFSKITDHILSSAERDSREAGFSYDRYRIFQSARYRIIFFDDGLIEAGYVEKEAYQRELTAIFSILSGHYPHEEIAVKYHPGYPGDTSILSGYNTIPEYIPAEFLYNEYVHVYLSMVSLALAGVDRGVVISIADLITFNDPVMKTELKEYLVRHSRSKVLFPATMDELDEIIRTAAG